MPAPTKESVPRELHEMGVMVLDVAELLVLILGDLSANSNRLASQVRNINDACKRLAQAIVEQLDRAHVKPLDQDILRNVSHSLEAVIGLLERVSSSVVLFKQEESIPFTAQIAEVLSQQSRAIAAALSGLRNGGPSLDLCEEIIRPKEEVDRLHESSILHLFDTVKDPIEVIKRKQIIDALKQASKIARDVGYILKPLTYNRMQVH